jgi:hypothetical protein
MPDHGAMATLTRAIVKRHALLADDGKTLRVTLGRLRKTMENRLWKLSNGDLLAVSAVMGHSPQVADNHYLRLDEQHQGRGGEIHRSGLARETAGRASRRNTDGKLQR